MWSRYDDGRGGRQTFHSRAGKDDCPATPPPLSCRWSLQGASHNLGSTSRERRPWHSRTRLLGARQPTWEGPDTRVAALRATQEPNESCRLVVVPVMVRSTPLACDGQTREAAGAQRVSDEERSMRPRYSRLRPCSRMICLWGWTSGNVHARTSPMCEVRTRSRMVLKTVVSSTVPS